MGAGEGEEELGGAEGMTEEGLEERPVLWKYTHKTFIFVKSFMEGYRRTYRARLAFPRYFKAHRCAFFFCSVTPETIPKIEILRKIQLFLRIILYERILLNLFYH